MNVTVRHMLNKSKRSRTSVLGRLLKRLSTRRHVSLRIGLTLLFGILLVGLISIEAAVRLTQPYTTPDFDRPTMLQYEATLFSRNAFPQMRQEVRDRLDPGSEEVSEQGYRGRSFAVPKPGGVVRVVVLGGSAAFDIFAEEGRDWPHLVEESLHRRGLQNVEVINAATPGHATWDVLGRLFAEIWMFEPDYVVVYEAWNDIKYFPWLTPSRSLLRGYRPPPVLQVGEHPMVWNPFMYYAGPLDRLLGHSQVYIRLRRRYWWWRLGQIGPEGLLGIAKKKEKPAESSFPDTYSPWGPRQYELALRLIANAAHDIGAVPVLLTQARLVSPSDDEESRGKIPYAYIGMSHAALLRAFADCDTAVMRAAEAAHAKVMDLSRMLTGRRDLFVDHVHTTPAGSQALAEAVAGYLAQVIAETSAKPGTELPIGRLRSSVVATPQ